jgi:hypothetical protein
MISTTVWNTGGLGFQKDLPLKYIAFVHDFYVNCLLTNLGTHKVPALDICLLEQDSIVITK